MVLPTGYFRGKWNIFGGIFTAEWSEYHYTMLGSRPQSLFFDDAANSGGE